MLTKAATAAAGTLLLNAVIASESVGCTCRSSAGGGLCVRHARRTSLRIACSMRPKVLTSASSGTCCACTSIRWECTIAMASSGSSEPHASRLRKISEPRQGPLCHVTRQLQKRSREARKQTRVILHSLRVKQGKACGDAERSFGGVGHTHRAWFAAAVHLDSESCGADDDHQRVRGGAERDRAFLRSQRWMPGDSSVCGEGAVAHRSRREGRSGEVDEPSLGSSQAAHTTQGSCC